MLALRDDSSRTRASPNRVGWFATFISLAVFLVGALLAIGAGYGDSAQKTFGAFLTVVGLIGTVFSYVGVRLFFWAFRPSPPRRRSHERPVRPVAQPPDPTLKGIGGWLVLVVIGLAITPLLNIASLVRDFDPHDPSIDGWADVSVDAGGIGFSYAGVGKVNARPKPDPTEHSISSATGRRPFAHRFRKH